MITEGKEKIQRARYKRDSIVMHSGMPWVVVRIEQNKEDGFVYVLENPTSDARLAPVPEHEIQPFKHVP